MLLTEGNTLKPARHVLMRGMDSEVTFFPQNKYVTALIMISFIYSHFILVNK